MERGVPALPVAHVYACQSQSGTGTPPLYIQMIPDNRVSREKPLTSLCLSNGYFGFFLVVDFL